MVPKHNIITIDVSLDLKKVNKRETIPDIRNLAILWDCKVIYLTQESMTITLQDKNICKTKISVQNKSLQKNCTTIQRNKINLRKG